MSVICLHRHYTHSFHSVLFLLVVHLACFGRFLHAYEWVRVLSGLKTDVKRNGVYIVRTTQRKLQALAKLTPFVKTEFIITYRYSFL